MPFTLYCCISPGLFAAGEVTMTGMHGANRLASNSLLEAVVVSKYAAIRTVEVFNELPKPTDVEYDSNSNYEKTELEGPISVKKVRKQLVKTMSELVAIVRSEQRLTEAQKTISEMKNDVDTAFSSAPLSYDLIELRNLAVIAELITKSALWRKESRGLHFMEDYPKALNEFKRNSEIKNSVNRRSTVA